MAIWKHPDSGISQLGRTKFFFLLVLIVITLAVLGCTSSATPIPTPQPATTTPPLTDTPPATSAPPTAVDIGQQVVEAVQKPGLITVIDTTIDSQVGDESQRETGRVWLDFPGHRVRIEGWLDEEPSTISLVVDGTTVEYSRKRDQIDEYPVRFFGMSLEEARDTLPKHLSNPALLGLVPLSGVLVHTRGELRPAGDGQWQGSPVTIWRADFPEGPEGYDHTYTTIYLEPETFRPLGQEVQYTATEAQSPKSSDFTMSVTYQLDFVSLNDAPRDVFTPGRIFHPDEPTPTPLPTAGPTPTALPRAPESDLPPTADESNLLRVMQKLPASFGEQGVWFADYARAWELNGLPPLPGTVEGFAALSDEEKEAYANARRGLAFGPSQFLAAKQYAREWEELLGFSGFAVSLVVGTGDGDRSLFGTAYLAGEVDPEDVGQRLLDLGYHRELVDGRSYYAIRGDRDIDPQSPTRQLGVRAQMNRVFLADGVVAASPDTDPIVDLVSAHSGDIPVLVDDPVSSRLAVSLRRPLSATLLHRSSVLEPVGRPKLSYETYKKPQDWASIHQWEALGAGYALVDGQPWWAISLFYPDSEAAEADAEEIVNRMNGYRTAITDLMYPHMSDEGLAAAAEFPYPISESCVSLTPVYASDETGSVLTVWCQAGEQSSALWLRLMEYRDLGCLLP